MRTHIAWSNAYVAPSSKPPNRVRLLLDQGFPKPTGFDMAVVDKRVDTEHLSDWRRDLSERSTPDWAVYCEAAWDGFTAVVTRDFSQSAQAEEMLVLSRLQSFHVITWSQRMDDPITEWGQLIAFIPRLLPLLAQRKPAVIQLPVPCIRHNPKAQPKEALGLIAKRRGVANHQMRSEARAFIEEWEASVAMQPGRYSRRLGLS